MRGGFFFQESSSGSSNLEILVIQQKFLVIQDHRITLFSDCDARHLYTKKIFFSRIEFGFLKFRDFGDTAEVPRDPGSQDHTFPRL